MTWTVAEKGVYPCDHGTACCKRRIYAGDVAVVIPFFMSNNPTGTVVCHARCLARFMERVPKDRKIIEEEFYAIRGSFVRKSNSSNDTSGPRT